MLKVKTIINSGSGLSSEFGYYYKNFSLVTI
jgi:hypothetical protein